MIRWDIWRRIAKRCVLEFGPPAAAGLVWAFLNRAPATTFLDYFGFFSTAFGIFGLAWWNFLRIQYQQTNRAAQEEAGSQLVELADDVGRVEELLKNQLTPLLQSIGNRLSPQEMREISRIVDQANTAIETANTTVRTFTQDAISFQRLRLRTDGAPTANS